MASERDGILLDHISDTVTEIREGQAAILAALTRLVEAGEAQTEMLSEILAAARQEQGPSDVAAALAEVAEAVRANTTAVDEMAEHLTALPGQIGIEVAEAMMKGPAAGSP